MKIIDAHLHFSNIASFCETARTISHLDYSGAGLAQEFAAAGVVAGIGMGLTERCPGGFPDASASNPMLLDLEPELPRFLTCCLGINPAVLGGTDGDHELARLQKVMAEPWVVGIKIYAGYYWYYVDDPIYDPVYDLAASYDLPIVIHGGLTYSDRGLLKYSHPLRVDEIAVRRPELRFIIAHLGDPWVMETGALIMKNPNVYTDMSGLLVGDSRALREFRGQQLLMECFQRPLIYAKSYDKVLYGSDWPLAPIADYVELAKDLLPADMYKRVFYENALKVFPRLKEVLTSDS